MSDTTPIPLASERELLPCPFCGHDSPEFERMGTSRQSCIVICGNCGARHESGDEYLRSGSSWNTRAALSHPSTPQGWKDMAYAKLGAVRDKMAPQHVDAVQRFLRDEYAAPPPPEQGGKG